MAWENSVVTNAGIALLRLVLAGGQLAITSAKGGTGTVSAAALMTQTQLVNQKQTFTVISSENTSSGKKVEIRISNIGLNTSYVLNQIGIYAAVDNGTPALLAILQDETGIKIPSVSEVTEFLLEFFANVNFNNAANFNVSVDSNTYATLREIQAVKQIAEAAKISAEDSQAKAATAVTNAATAQSTANTAAANAAAAQTKAENAATTAAAAQTTANAAIPASEKGQPNGVATLANGVLTASQATKIPKNIPSSRALELDDANKTLTIGSNMTLTIPAAASVNFPVGTEIIVSILIEGVVVTFAPENNTVAIRAKVLSFTGQNTVRLIKTSSNTTNVWAIEGIYPNAHPHDVTDLTNVVRSKTFTALPSFINKVIPLVSLDNTDIAANSYFSGDILLRRKTGLFSPRHIRLTASKKDTSEEVVWSALSSANNPAEGVGYRFVTFLYGGKKYFGLQLLCVTASYDTVELFGECSNWGAIAEKSYYNVQTSTVLNAEINDSLAVLSSSHTYHRAQEFFKAPVVRDNNSDTMFEVLYRGNMGTGSLLDADKLDSLHATAFDILGYTGRTVIPDGTNLDTLTTPGAYVIATAASMATMVNPPKLGSGGYFNVRSGSGVTTQIFIGWGDLYFYRLKGAKEFNRWVNMLDGNNAEKLGGFSSDKYMVSDVGVDGAQNVLTWGLAQNRNVTANFANTATGTPWSGYWMIELKIVGNWRQLRATNINYSDEFINTTYDSINWTGWVGTAELDAYGKVKPEQTTSRWVDKYSSFTLSLDDQSCMLHCFSTSPIVVTVPTNESVALPIGTEIEILRGGSGGAVTISPASGVHVHSSGTASPTVSRNIADPVTAATLKKFSTNEWVLLGNLE